MSKTKSKDPIANLDKLPSKPVVEEQANCIRKHFTSPGVERYHIKLKDKFGHQGLKIGSPVGREMSLMEIRVFKVAGENNAIVIELLKGI